MNKNIFYILYDGRYHTRPDRAICLEVCDTLKEARNSAPDYGTDTVIVECQRVGIKEFKEIKIVRK